MPLADPYKTGEDSLTAIQSAALDAIRNADAVEFRDVCRATAIHGDHQATEKALLELRRLGHVLISYGSGMIRLRRTDEGMA